MKAPKRPGVTAAGQLTGGFLSALKRRHQLAEVWAIRGKIQARVIVAARDARLSGAEWSVLTTIMMHLQHLGRSKGFMTFETLADDCRVTERTIRNALRTLVAMNFLTIRYRTGGKMELMLARRFSPRADVPANADPTSPRRSAARKKISTKVTPLRSVTLKDECTDSAPKVRRESPGATSSARTAQRHREATSGHDPPRKRAPR